MDESIVVFSNEAKKMEKITIDNYSSLIEKPVTVTSKIDKCGSLLKYENDKFYIKYESNGELEEFSIEDFKSKRIAFKDPEIEKAVLSKIRKDEFSDLESSLFNTEAYNTCDPESRHSIILEQWRVTVETAVSVSTRRQTINNLFITLLTILISGVLFSEALYDSNKTFQLIVSIIVSILGIAICYEWIAQIKNYRDLNDTKYSIIRKIERLLPITVFSSEYTEYYNKNNEDKSFSKRERNVPFYFIGAFVLIALVALISLAKIGVAYCINSASSTSSTKYSTNQSSIAGTNDMPSNYGETAIILDADSTESSTD